MALNLLPGPDGWHLYACEAEQLKRLAPFPVTGELMWCWSDDRSHVLAVDQARKRVSTFRLEGESFKQTMSPNILPHKVKAHCIAMKGMQPYIGDVSLWLPRGTQRWEQIAIPEFARGAGKRLDGLLIDGDRLIAVDNLMLPKYNLEYDITDAANPIYVEAHRIRPNITYEHIYAAARGTRWFVTLSTGINHGNQASYCTVFHLETLRRAWVYPFWRQEGRFRVAIDLSCAVFLGDKMCLLANHVDGPRLHWLDLTNEVLPQTRQSNNKFRSDMTPVEREKRRMERAERLRKPRPEMTPPERERRERERAKRLSKPHLFETNIRRLTQVHHLQACGSGKGIYVTGHGLDGQVQSVWQAMPLTSTMQPG